MNSQAEIEKGRERDLDVVQRKREGERENHCQKRERGRAALFWTLCLVVPVVHKFLKVKNTVRLTLIELLIQNHSIDISK